MLGFGEMMAGANSYADGMMFLLDAGSTSSIRGYNTQTWYNIAPSAQSTFNFQAGLSSSGDSADPAFSGSFDPFDGYKGDPTAYWTFDGGDRFQLNSQNSYTDSFHQDNAKFTLACVLRHDNPSLAGSGARIFTTDDAQGNAQGVVLVLRPDYKLWFDVTNGPNDILSIYSDATISAGTYHFIALSVNETTGTGFFYVDGSYFKVGGNDTFGVTYASPSTASSVQPFGIGNPPNLSRGFVGRLPWAAGWNRALTKAELDSCKAQLSPRYGM